MEDKFYPLLDELYEGVYIIDRHRKILYWNKSAEEITGYKAEEVIGKSCQDNILKHIDKEGTELCKHFCPMVLAMKKKIKIKDEVYLHHKTGYRLLVSIKGIPIVEDNKVKGAIELFIPVVSSLNNENEQDLLSLALKDPLTRLYNRRGFDFIYPLRQREMMRIGYETACLFFDIDNFKKINDEFGHDAGDKFLIAIATTLTNLSRHYDITVRWGGEEFLLIQFIKDRKYLNTVCDKILKTINSVFIEHEKGIIRTTISGGVTLLRKEEDIKDAIKRADELMYQAKKSGKNRCIVDI